MRASTSSYQVRVWVCPYSVLLFVVGSDLYSGDPDFSLSLTIFHQRWVIKGLQF